MAIEKSWTRQGPVAFTQDGTESGLVTVNSVECFKVKQKISIKSDIQSPKVLQIKRIPSLTQIIVGPIKDEKNRNIKNLNLREDLSAYTVADNAIITAEEQSKVLIPRDDIWQAVYEFEPTVALRTVGVDKFGNVWDSDNPFPIDISKSPTAKTFNTFIRDSVEQIVTEDTLDPSNNKPLPVKLTGFSGDVAIAADNLNLEIQLKGEYSGLNTNPDNVGIISHQRSAVTDHTDQIERPTSVRGSTNTDTVSQDVSLHDHAGNEYTPTNAFPITIHGDSPDGQKIGNIGNSLKVTSDSDTPITTQSRDTQTDMFNRMRVSNPRNIFEYQFRYDIGTSAYWATQNINGATQTFNADQVGYYLNGATQAGSQAILQSRRYVEYLPGKSKQIFFTGNFNGAQVGWIKRYGTFDDNNGLFFELNELAPRVVVRTATSGSSVDVPVERVDWNGDKLDGTGSSGFTIDFTKQQLFFIEYAYLGTGDVRFGFIIDGVPIVIHRAHHANLLNFNYMQSGILPMRFSLDAVGIPAAIATMQISCISSAIEGDASENGRIRAGNLGTNATTFNANETFIFGLRVNSLYPYSSVKGESFQILPNSGNNKALWRIYLNPTLAGPAPTWVDNLDSITQSISNSPSVSGGILLASGYLSLTNLRSTTITRDLISDIFLGRDISGIADILVLTLETTAGNGSAYFAGEWKEIM
jgi:hypothetical protein